MKIYFNFSGRSPAHVRSNCKVIYSTLKHLGFSHMLNPFDDLHREGLSNNSNGDVEKLFSSSIKAVMNSKIIALEVTTNSFTQGFLLQKALELNKPVIAFYQKDSVPIFAEGIKSDLLQLVEYDQYNLVDTIKDSIKIAKENSECRFNFYLNYDLLNYLKYISKKHNKSKSAFVREMLEEKMSTDQEYLN